MHCRVPCRVPCLPTPSNMPVELGGKDFGGGRARGGGGEAPTCGAGVHSTANSCPQLFSSKTSACRLLFPCLSGQAI